MFEMRENCSGAWDIFMSILEVMQPWWKHLLFLFFLFFFASQFNYFRFHPMHHAF